MFLAFAFLLFILVICDAVVAGSGLPIPGPALGLMVLFAIFCWRGGPDPGSGRIFDMVAPHVALFFVPAAVGVVASLNELGQSWGSILVAVLVGTSITLGVTGLIAQALMRRLDRLRPPGRPQ